MEHHLFIINTGMQDMKINFMKVKNDLYAVSKLILNPDSVVWNKKIIIKSRERFY